MAGVRVAGVGVAGVEVGVVGGGVPVGRTVLCGRADRFLVLMDRFLVVTDRLLVVTGAVVARVEAVPDCGLACGPSEVATFGRAGMLEVTRAESGELTGRPDELLEPSGDDVSRSAETPADDCFSLHPPTSMTATAISAHVARCVGPFAIGPAWHIRGGRRRAIGGGHGRVPLPGGPVGGYCCS